jgi:hypothetical protein
MNINPLTTQPKSNRKEVMPLDIQNPHLLVPCSRGDVPVVRDRSC